LREILVKTSNEAVREHAKNMNIETVENDEPKVIIECREDEEKAVRMAEKSNHIFIQSPNWKIISLENLVAKVKGKTKLIAEVKNSEEAKLALEVLELGVDGILLETNDLGELEKTVRMLQERSMGILKLEEAVVTEIKLLGLGARACIDTCSLMKNGEGMLVGNFSQGMFVVESEVEATPLTNPRPFRVNAGAISLYTLTPNGKTKYLSEIKAGDQILIIDREGSTKPAFVVRSKIEIRPLVLIKAEAENREAAVTLQMAETVKLMTSKGSKPVTDLKPGDKVIAHFEQGGRHFGTLVPEEFVLEK